MALPFYNWSRTAASNASADSTVNWSEGQAPSSVNDSARAMMASAAAYRDDVAGGITTGGTATAYTVTSYQIFDTLAHMAGQKIAFIPNATNTNTVGNDVTLNVDGLGAKPIRMQPSVALPGGTLVLGTPYIVTYNNSDAVFYLQNMTNPYAVPLGGMMDFTGPTVPNSCFAFPIGQAISRTTYATYFTQVGTTYGVGDGSTTFNVIDVTGRTTAMKEASATRLTSTYFVGDSTALGAVGGGESKTLVAGNLPAYTPTGTISGTVSTIFRNYAAGSAGAEHYAVVQSSGDGAAGTGNTLAATFTGTAAAGQISTPFRTVQPTIICNKILRII